MAVHIELAELDEMCEEPAADGGQRFTATRISDGLGRRRLPATVARRLVMRFHAEPGPYTVHCTIDGTLESERSDHLMTGKPTTI